MKRLFCFVVVCSWILALLVWKSVKYTRLDRPELVGWAHDREQAYGAFLNFYRYFVCPPCAVLEPVLVASMKRVEASAEEQAWITHAPDPDLGGFHHLTRRGHSWTFVPWVSWVLYWIPVCVIWWLFVKRFFVR